MNLSINSKKIVLVLSLFFLFSIVSPVLADCSHWENCTALVCCGIGDPLDADNYVPCSFNDLFCLANKLIIFILKDVVPPLAIVWFAIGGITMMTAGGDPSKIETGKKMLTYGVVGVLIVYGAWLIVYEFVTFMTGGDPSNWPLQFFKP